MRAMHLTWHIYTGVTNETCLKWPLKNRQNEGLKATWKLNAGQKYCSILQYFCPALSDYGPAVCDCVIS